MRRRLAGALLLTFIAGCGSSGHNQAYQGTVPTTTPAGTTLAPATTLSLSALGERYLSIVAPALLRVAWPDHIRTDINALVTGNDVLIADVENASSAAASVQQIASDGAKFGAAASIVRADLGLPPPSS